MKIESTLKVKMEVYLAWLDARLLLPLPFPSSH